MGEESPPLKYCKKCTKKKPATSEYWYIQRARKGHKEGLQSNCKDCWKEINKLNKKRIRQK